MIITRIQGPEEKVIRPKGFIYSEEGGWVPLSDNGGAKGGFKSCSSVKRENRRKK